MMAPRSPFIAAAAVALATVPTNGFVFLAPIRPLPSSTSLVSGPQAVLQSLRASEAPTNDGDAAEATAAAAEEDRPPAPTFNGKVILPMRVLSGGLKGHKVAAVYAVMNSGFKKGSGDGWEFCEHVGVTRDLYDALQTHVRAHGKGDVAHVRALSFAYPQRSAMEEVGSQWRSKAAEAGGAAAEDGWAVDGEAERREELVALMEATADFDDDDDDDEDDDFYDNIDFTAEKGGGGAESANGEEEEEEGSVVSPFASEATINANGEEEALVFNRESVDKVLDEVRPYLINDGGNVAVQSIDEETKNVYLVLEGACGSCASSTVTMQMGIERVLKENFPDLGEVIQVEDPAIAEAQPTELTPEAVEAEVSRIAPAVIAMGGVIRIVSVDPLGVVELEYRGSNKVKQGLELAILDVPFVKHVKFVSS